MKLRPFSSSWKTEAGVDSLSLMVDLLLFRASVVDLLLV